MHKNPSVLVLAFLAALCAALAFPALAQPPFPVPPAETLILFDPDAGETPESIRFDRQDNAYLSFVAFPEIRKVTPDLQQSVLATLPLGSCPPKPAVVLGLAMDRHDRLYAAVNTCDPATHGIWRFDTATGAGGRVIEVPFAVTVNGIDVDGDHLYMADTFGGRVWRAPLQGGVATVWADDPLLKIDPARLGPGPNGLLVFEGEVYVAVSSRETMVTVPILPDGGAGPAQVYFTFPAGIGCDEFAFDVLGALYCTTDPTNLIYRIAPGGAGGEAILTAADLLDGPTSVAFGRRGENRKNLYITNAAFPFFTTTFRPSLMRVRLGVPGAPAAR